MELTLFDGDIVTITRLDGSVATGTYVRGFPGSWYHGEEGEDSYVLVARERVPFKLEDGELIEVERPLVERVARMLAKQNQNDPDSFISGLRAWKHFIDKANEVITLVQNDQRRIP